MTKFASQVEVVYMPVENSQGKSYQKPYMRITDFNNEEIYIQLRDDLNVPEFSRILVSALDYNTISVAAKFAPLKEAGNTNEKSSTDKPNMSEVKNVLEQVIEEQTKKDKK